MKKGKLIVLEGIDGCGKDTQQKLLQEKFSEFVYFHVLDENQKHTNTLRDSMFNCNHRWSTTSEMLMFWADKFEIIQQIKKCVDEGKNVIMNRWELSNLAYQIWGKQNRGLEEFARFMQQKLDSILKPDLYILYDISVDESSRRKAARNGLGYDRTDYYEDQKRDFFERVIAGYRTEIQKYNHVIINGEQSKEKVFGDTVNAIRTVIK